LLEPETKVPLDVLQERERGTNVAYGCSDEGPEVSSVVLACARPSERERLAGVTGKDEIHSAAVVAARPGRQVVPDRSRIHFLARHPRHEAGRREHVPLDVTHNS
jgi:hypothetical protein